MFISYIGALSPAPLARLEHAERQPSALPLSALSDDEKAEAGTLSYILAQALSGSNLQSLMNVGECNGYEGWRHLVHREEPTAGSAQVGQLTSILKARFPSKLEYYDDEVQKFESQVLT